MALWLTQLRLSWTCEADQMFVLVTPMRIKGIPLTAQERRSYPPIKGYVMVTAEISSELGRSANVAWIHSSSPNQPPALPKLLDAALSGMSHTGFVLTGIEHLDGCAYAQSWWCREA